MRIAFAKFLVRWAFAPFWRPWLAAIACLAVSGIGTAWADNLPRWFVGVWGTDVSRGGSCHAPSFPGSDNPDAEVRISFARIDFPDIGCKIASVRASDQNLLDVRMNLSCAGEGYQWSGSATSRIQTINGEDFLMVAGGPDDDINVYRRCQ
jgi:hypothetical protein